MEDLENELGDLKEWFFVKYREQYEKCKRKIDLGIKLRDGSDPKLVLEKLYDEAEIKASRINEIRKQLNEGEKDDSSSF